VPSLNDLFAEWTAGEGTQRQTFPLDGGGTLATAVAADNGTVRVGLACDAARPVTLHWGLAWRSRNEWQAPPENLIPAGTTIVQPPAARSAFAPRDGVQWLELDFEKPAEGAGPRGLRFVVFRPEDGAWIKSGGQDLYLPLFQPPPDPRLPAQLRDLAEEIVTAERDYASWTLMHRFNLCHDLLGKARGDEDALALLFVWLRYSAIRQLDWQRRYNTKPRELAHAQDRLTRRLAQLFRESGPGPRMWARLMLTTLGRGGDGQKVRDEILQIMHRNHIKETSGHFIEEWHQKLHNNTTPDDVVICAAYLEFLRSNGDVARFYKTLEAEGVTRERLRSFERPIKSDPNFFGDKKDALIGEFSNFLKILKAVHSGTDLESAVAAARDKLDGGARQKVEAVLGLRAAGGNKLIEATAAARAAVAGATQNQKDDVALRDLLFLDLGLADCFRGAVERQNHSKLDRDALAALIDGALANLTPTADSPELALIAAHWKALLAQPRDGRDWALQARSVADRAARWVQGCTDSLYRRVQPKAEVLGEGFGAAKWVVPLFGEEVVRGGSAFALSLLLKHLDPILRTAAGIGGWQIVSPGRAFGTVRVAASLETVQAEQFAGPTVLIADHVAGDEEIPASVTAVLTLDAPDLVSHVAVRARNAHVLFAACFDRAVFDQMKTLSDRTVTLSVTPRGDVEWREGGSAVAEPTHTAAAPAGRRIRRDVAEWAVGQDGFTSEIVGGKSNNLGGLRGRLPEWVHLPASFALPWGTCEKVLRDPANAATRDRIAGLTADPGQDPAAALAQVREAFLGLKEPAGFQEAVLSVWRSAGVPMIPWESAWRSICRVWASKWNERAYLSRRARSVPHDDLLMAVLVQQVVEADYAFVIHTTNPLTGDAGELYAEMVLGMGETLVGNHPGRALGFVCRKSDQSLTLQSYPGKSVGLYGKGVIFRSDSNGEDLEGFAGAGLYDSYLAVEPEHRLLDYTRERLVNDRGFRDELLRSVARVGLEVERVLGSPQDVEGAVTGGRCYVVQTRPQVGLTSAP
jgi:alpha-glucan,water dikinase